MSTKDFTKNPTICDVPVYYDRADHAVYGTADRLTDIYGMPALHEALNKAFIKLIEVFGRGLPTAILTAGSYVDKPGWHGRGLAFDLDGIAWPNYKITAKDYLTQRDNYLVIDACLRQFFPTVLDAFYNKAHQDHFHVQLDGSSMGYNQHSTSDTKYVQTALNHLCGAQLKVDGVYGDKTMEVLLDFLDEGGLTRDISGRGGYYQFNDRVIWLIQEHRVPESDKVYDVAAEMQQLLKLIDTLGPLCAGIQEKREFLETLLINRLK